MGQKYLPYKWGTNYVVLLRRLYIDIKARTDGNITFCLNLLLTIDGHLR